MMTFEKKNKTISGIGFVITLILIMALPLHSKSAGSFQNGFNNAFNNGNVNASDTTNSEKTGISTDGSSQNNAQEELNLPGISTKGAAKQIAYIVSDTGIPFWNIMAKGIERAARHHGCFLSVYSADNSRKKEFTFVARAIRDQVDGLIVSPTSSSACATILKLANDADIPVVISDIGTDGGEYLSYISSNNFEGAYEIGKVLTRKMISKGWMNASVGIVAIPQKRKNGRERTAGFMKALDEAGIRGADIKQQTLWTEDETYHFCMDMIQKNPDLRALWLQGSDRYKGALRAIADSGKKQDILLVTFDSEPEFIQLIQDEVILGSAMQQPYLMGQKAFRVLMEHLNGQPVSRHIEIPILTISKENIMEKLPIIQQNVLGL